MDFVYDIYCWKLFLLLINAEYSATLNVYTIKKKARKNCSTNNLWMNFFSFKVKNYLLFKKYVSRCCRFGYWVKIMHTHKKKSGGNVLSSRNFPCHPLHPREWVQLYKEEWCMLVLRVILSLFSEPWKIVKKMMY